MNGQKLKVTIRVVDNPPRYRDECSTEQKELSTDISRSKDENDLSVEDKPVYQTSATLNVSDKRSSGSQEAKPVRYTSRNLNHEIPEACDTHSDSKMDGVWKKSTTDSCRADTDNHYRVKPLEIKNNTTSILNINKLRRYYAVDQFEICEQGEGICRGRSECKGSSSLGDVSNTTANNSSTVQRAGLLCLDNDLKLKRAVEKRINGYNVNLATPVTNSNIGYSRFNRSYRHIMSSTVNGVVGDDGLGMECFSGDASRPPFTREGSTCSTDSVITEIEALTDDELAEVQTNLNTSEGDNGEDECAKRNRGLSNWKKIRGMIHWQPFAKSYKKKYPWVQLAGHQGNFKAGESGTILKKTDEVEKECLIKLMNDDLQPFVPEFKREVENHEERYLVMQDLLCGFDAPSVMDCKMGIRTFSEDELEKARQQPKMRKDLYQKMIDIDPSAPTEEERENGAITKPRYMKWREELSSSATLGFRIEGIKKSGEKPHKDFKTTRTPEDLGEKFRDFTDNDPDVKAKYLKRLTTIRCMLESSSFFRVHEVIGSSLLFVHDHRGDVSVWMIDFAKTKRVNDGIILTHREKWKEGNHEDGYLFGLDNMISIWSNL